MYWNTFLCAYTWTVRPINTIFSRKRAIPDLNNLYPFQAIQRIFTKIRARKDTQSNRIHNYFPILLESIQNNFLPFHQLLLNSPDCVPCDNFSTWKVNWMNEKSNRSKGFKRQSKKKFKKRHSKWQTEFLSNRRHLREIQ